MSDIYIGARLNSDSLREVPHWRGEGNKALLNKGDSIPNAQTRDLWLRMKKCLPLHHNFVGDPNEDEHAK